MPATTHQADTLLSSRGTPIDHDARILDQLTRAYSIEYFEHQLRSELAYSMRHEMPVSLLLVAIDYLDDLLTTFNRETADRVLIRVADVIRAHIRTEDVLARYGVGEFALLGRGSAIKEAGFLAKRLRQAVESAFLSYEGMELPVTVSIGVATLPAGAEEAVNMVQNAERALSEARQTGNCMVIDGWEEPE